jgi:8-oxo-dGTP pyrophosphatase MutT (NUDIX family)
MVFKTLSQKIVWSCPWYSVRQDEILLPDGRPGVYNVVQKEAAVWIVPVTAEKKVVLIPAGSLKPGQNPTDAARSELAEEIGGRAQHLEYLGQSYMANGICDEIGHFFLATGVTLSEPEHEAAEVIEVHLKSIPEILSMARANEINDAPSALVILLCASRLQKFAS